MLGSDVTVGLLERGWLQAWKAGHEMNVQPQGELFAEVRWFHLFRSMVDSGELAEMSGSAVKVYLVIKSHTNFETGLAFPTVPTIAMKSGISEAQVKRELLFLEKKGYIAKARRGRQNIYALRERLHVRDGRGNPAATLDWTYLPLEVAKTLDAIKEKLSTGEISARGAININNVQVTINQIGSAGPIGIAQSIQTNLAILPPELRAAVCSAMSKAGVEGHESYTQLMGDTCHPRD